MDKRPPLIRKPITKVPGSISKEQDSSEEDKNISNPDNIMPSSKITPIWMDEESFGSICPKHSKNRRLYCYKKCKFICEDCTDDESDIIQSGHISKWVLEKSKIDRLANEQQAQSQSGRQEMLIKLKNAVNEEYAKSHSYLEDVLKKNDLISSADEKLTLEQKEDLYNLMKVKYFAENVVENDKTLERNLQEQLNRQNMYNEGTFKNLIEEMLQ
jgi:hypothetical protein